MNALSRQWAVTQRGLAKLLGDDPRPLTMAQKREVARERRDLIREAERRVLNKREKKRAALLQDFDAKNLRSAHRKNEQTPGSVGPGHFRGKRDIADRALDGWRTRLALHDDPDLRVWFVPDDPGAGWKRWDMYSEFRKFARLPHYKKAFAEEAKHGRFVLGRFREGYVPEERKPGTPWSDDVIIEEELGRGNDDGTDQKTGRGSRPKSKKATGARKRNSGRKRARKKR